MSDFNSDNSKIDTALKTNADAIADEAAARNALAQTVADKGNCQLYFQTYTGNGSTRRTFTFPRQPKLVLLGGDAYTVLAAAGSTVAPCYATNGTGTQGTASWSGASVTLSFSAAQHLCNNTNTTYMVVAWIAADA